jgi:CheY-like chemotaxis protein
VTELSTASDTAPRILIADDDPSIVKVLAERCTRMGFIVETANNGIQALLKARRDAPALLIIDVNMPGADGLSVCARLLAGATEKSLDVVVVTGSGNPEMIKRCESMGAFYAHKGPHFWYNITTALTGLFPNLAGSIKESTNQSIDAEISARPRLLFIDDDPATKRLLFSRLVKHGVDMLCAHDGVQGFRIACKERPSVIISDYSVRNGSLIYLLWKFRSAPETENIPIFVTSALQLSEAVEQSLKREVCGRPGVAKIFRKPLDIQELFGSLREYCGFETHFIDEWDAAAGLRDASVQDSDPSARYAVD